MKNRRDENDLNVKRFAQRLNGSCEIVRFYIGYHARINEIFLCVLCMVRMDVWMVIEFILKKKNGPWTSSRKLLRLNGERYEIWSIKAWPFDGKPRNKRVNIHEISRFHAIRLKYIHLSTATTIFVHAWKVRKLS